MATPSLIAVASDDADDDEEWDMSKTQSRASQSITEVLQNPHQIRVHLDLPPPSPLSPLTRDSLYRRRSTRTSKSASLQYSINDFELYLRSITDRYSQYLSLASYSSAGEASGREPALCEETASSLPTAFFDEAFRVGSYPEIASLSDLSANSEEVASLRRSLDSYSSMVESSIFEAVRARSSEIARAVTALDSLRQASQITTAATLKLRTQTIEAASDVRQGAVQVSKVYHRRTGLARILQTTETVSKLLRNAEDLEPLVHAGEFDAAMDLMDATAAAIIDNSLADLRAAQIISKKISSAKDAMEKGLRETFQTLLVEVRSIEMESSSSQDKNSTEEVLADAYVGEKVNSLPKSALVIIDGPLQLIIRAVARLGRLVSLAQYFLSDLTNLIDDIVAGAVTASPNPGKSVLDGLYAIRRAIIGGEPICKLFSISSQNDPTQAARLQEVMDSFTTKIDDRSTELTSHILKDPSPFVRDGILGIVRFADTVRGIFHVASQMGAYLPGKIARMRGLYATVGERSRALVIALHRQQMDSLSKLLAREKWIEVKVPGEVQGWVDQLRGVASTRESIMALDADPILNSRTMAGYDDGRPPVSPVSKVSAPTHFWEIPAGLSDQSHEEDADVLMIVNESFKMVPTGLVVLKSVVMYVVCATELGIMTAIGGEVVRRCCEYLRSFNETSSRLVLGAGAMRTAGLKSITARHLALSSRVIGACLAVSRLVEETTKDYLPPEQVSLASSQLARVTKDLADHELQLLSKIRGVMLERLDYHLRSYEMCKWDAETKLRVLDIPTPSITALIKETSVLHRILQSLLPRPSMSAMFGGIGAVYGEKLSQTFDRISGLSPGAKWISIRLSADVRFLHLKLRGMEAFGGISTIDTLVKKYGELPESTLKLEQSDSVLEERLAPPESPKDAAANETPGIECGDISGKE